MTTSKSPQTAARACVIGWPIAHSRSPAIHSYWLAQLNIDGSYTKEAVPPDQLASFMNRVASGEFLGCNVTIPHKQSVIRHLAAIDATAEMIGAVNTIWREGSRFLGTNTDMEGFLNNLDAEAPGWDHGGTAIVVGAGGAARAVLAGLLDRKFESVVIANRTVETAVSLASEFAEPGHKITAKTLEALSESLGDASVLINATSLGMVDAPPLKIEIERLPTCAVVNDLVYAPLETDLLKRARDRGCRTVDGLGMLLHQAAGGFEKWFGERPPVNDDLRAHVLNTES